MLVFNLTQNKEEEFIQKICAPLTFDSKYAQRLKDDVAFLQSTGKIIITTDSVSEGIHYKNGTEPFKVAHKLLARNLSDIASKGAKPIAYTLSIIKPEGTNQVYLSQFASGLKDLSSKFKMPLIGGDISSSKSEFFSANITMFGEITHKIPARFNAKPNEKIYITGQLGRAFLGFLGETPFLPFYETPLPPVNLMRQLHAKHKITAGIDISDGFLKDLSSLLFASGIGAEVDLAKIPIPKCKHSIEQLISFGDDYQIIFTSKDTINKSGVSLIGVTTKEKTLKIKNATSIPDAGYSQF